MSLNVSLADRLMLRLVEPHFEHGRRSPGAVLGGSSMGAPHSAHRTEGSLTNAIYTSPIGVPSTVRRSLAGLAGVERAVIFGSHARGTDEPDSDIDLLVVGHPDRDELTDRLERVGHEVGRPVNEVVMAPAELEARRARDDGFVASIDSGPVIEVAPDGVSG